MKLKPKPKPRIKTSDLHIRLKPKNHEVLKKEQLTDWLSLVLPYLCVHH